MNSTYRIIAALTGQRNTIPIPVMYVRAFGTYEAAAMLTQLTYWDDRLDPERDGWQYRTEQDWADELAFSRRDVEGARKALLKAEVIEYDLKGIPAKSHYRVKRDALVRFLEQLCAAPDCTNRTDKDVRLPTDKDVRTEPSSTEPTPEPTAEPPLPSPVPGSAFQEEQMEPGREDVLPFDPLSRRHKGADHTPAALPGDEQPTPEVEQRVLMAEKELGDFAREMISGFTGGPNPHPPVSPALPGLPEGSTDPSPLEVLARLKGSPVAEKMAAKKDGADHDRRKRHAIRNSIEDATLRGIHEFIPDGYEHAIRMMRETAMKPEKLLEWLRQKPNIVPALNAMTKPLYAELLAEARKTAAKYGPADKWKQYAYVWFIEGAVARMPVQNTETGNLSHKLGMQSDKMAELRLALKTMNSLLHGAALVQMYVDKGWVDIGHRTPQEFAELYVGLG